MLELDAGCGTETVLRRPLRALATLAVGEVAKNMRESALDACRVEPTYAGLVIKMEDGRADGSCRDIPSGFVSVSAVCEGRALVGELITAACASCSELRRVLLE